MAAGYTTAGSSADLVSLVSSTANSTIYPSDDALLSSLQSRFRADQPYSRLGASTLVVVNPLRTLSNLNDASAEQYRTQCYADAGWESRSGGQHPDDALPPHPYELAARTYHMMRRTKQSQAIVYSGATDSGKTFASKLVTAQLLRLASNASRREQKLAEQVRALDTLLNSFGAAKTKGNSNASRHGRYLELHFSADGRLGAAKVLTFGLDKARLCTPLASEERSFHIFYQLLAGATHEERENFQLDDVTSYALLSSSGCYRLPGGPSSDDSIAFEELRAAMRTLGFKAKHMASIFNLLSAILLLGNLNFTPSDGQGLDATKGEAAHVANRDVLEDVAEMLGVPPEDLEQGLTTRTRFVRKEQVSSLLSVAQAITQRDMLARDLYATLFAFVVETANHKLAPSAEEQYPTQIVQLDAAGYQSRAGSSLGAPPPGGQQPSGHHEFASNFVAEVVQQWLNHRAFDDSADPNNAAASADGIKLPEIVTGDNTACVELLRGSAKVGEGSAADSKPAGILGSLDKMVHRVRSGKAAEDDDAALVAELDTHVVHSSYVASSTAVSARQQATGLASAPRRVFGVNHFQSSCSYDSEGFMSAEMDVFDTSFVELLRRSTASFVAKLFAGPSLAAEAHPLDPKIVACAQVSVRPLRQPTPLRADADPAVPLLNAQRVYGVTRQLNASLSEILATITEAGHVWSVLTLRPNDIDQPNSFDARRVKAQVRSMLLPDLIARRRAEYVTGMTYADFCERYAASVAPAAAAAGVSEAKEKVHALAIASAWRETLDYAMGNDRVWLAYGPWRRLEDRLRTTEPPEALPTLADGASGVGSPTYPPATFGRSASYLSPTGDSDTGRQQLLGGGTAGKSSGAFGHSDEELLRQPSSDPFNTPGEVASTKGGANSDWGDWDKRAYGDIAPGVGMLEKSGNIDGRAIDAVEEEPTTSIRRWWVRITWLFTWWIPSFALSRCCGIKRPDVQMAWREKFTICAMIFLLCGSILFYIIGLGRILCPDLARAWNPSDLSQHAGTDDYYVAVRGKVYDLTKFWKQQHSDTTTLATNDVMLQLAGLDLTDYFPVPLTVGCPTLVTDSTVVLSLNTSLDTNPTISQAIHYSGTQSTTPGSALDADDWYPKRFLGFMGKRYKGFYVHAKKEIAQKANDRYWAYVGDSIYDLSNYVFTNSQNTGATANTNFLPNEISSLFTSQSGADITDDFRTAMGTLNSTTQRATQNCLDNVFYAGRVDFRESPKCTVQSYLLLAFSILIVATIAAKFLAALQLTTKRNPEQQDKFVICQVPCYTEGEEELRRTIDSLAGLKYDDKRKLLFIICDGMIVGSGNELPTPRIVLDILGVDPKIDPEPLMFKSVAEGSKQLNYGKVYSGLYEFEGHVVPYIVVVKVGRPSERTRPGNRGKRDTQILLMRYLNRVHFDAPMYPLELEIYHQMKNVIGIDPAFYEYVLMVDADTRVVADGLNRLVAVAADDSRIIALCGETRLENEEGSWWTMIQVYEYYISHHFAKAFESLFGSVTCLPGCFSMYRIRSADKGRPLFISNRIIDDYSENKVDTLHKKNLLSLGEDRYLTTLILKHFPAFRTKFTPDAQAHTSAPDRWGILLSQRRRWINSTVHNLAELVLMPELCGFCLFSMRFVVFVDLLGTIILPATTVYLIYLIVTVATHKAAIPIISLVMIGAVYGLQAIIFLMKRQWQYIGWLLIYLMAYPVWSFFLPLYSFWHMDDFSWGNTRIVVGEKGNKKIVAGTDDEPYDDSMIPLKRFSEYQRDVWEAPSATGDAVSVRSGATGVSFGQGPFGNAYAVPVPAASALGMGMPSMPSIHQKTASSFYGGSPAGSDVGGDYFRDTDVLARSRNHSRSASANQLQQQTPQPMPSRMPSMAFGGQHSPSMAPFPTAESMYGMMPGAPMNSMYGMMPAMMSNPSMYGMPMAGATYSPQGSDIGLGTANSNPALGGRASPAPLGPRMSTMPLGSQMTGMSASMSSANPFAPAGGAATAAGLSTNLNPSPTDEDLKSAVRTFLAAQPDLMQVSKRNVRDAVIASFPKATDLAGRKAVINKAIDDTLSGAA